MSWDLSDRSRAYLLDFVYIGYNGTLPATTVPIYISSSEAPLDVDERTYISDPNVEVELPTFDGAFDDKTMRIRIKDQFAEFRDMAGDRSFPRVRVRVRELSWDPKDLENAATAVLWNGQIDLVQQNPDSAEGMIEFTVGPCGGRIEKSITPSIHPLCWKTFGDPKTCTVDIASLEETGTVIAINGKALTITGLSQDFSDYWNRGSVFLHGVRIQITRWSRTAPQTFTLAQFPPKSFVEVFQLGSQPVTARPGCAHTPGACIRYQGDALNFGTLGTRMPGRNPLYENADD
jgi:hypothetical protein